MKLRRPIDCRVGEKKYGLRGRELGPHEMEFVPFTAQTRMSGVNMSGNQIRKGAVDAITKYLAANGGAMPPEVQASVELIARSGGTRWWWRKSNAHWA